MNEDDTKRFRKPMLKQFARIAQRWQLSVEEQYRLLGLTYDGSSTDLDFPNEEIQDEVFERFILLCYINRDLRTLFEEKRCATHLRAPSKRLNGDSALDVMLSSRSGLEEIAKMLSVDTQNPYL